MTNKWEDSDNPTLQIAAFKLMATDDEQRHCQPIGKIQNIQAK